MSVRRVQRAVIQSCDTAKGSFAQVASQSMKRTVFRRAFAVIAGERHLRPVAQNFRPPWLAPGRSIAERSSTSCFRTAWSSAAGGRSGSSSASFGRSL